jgi:hypothetical protein
MTYNDSITLDNVSANDVESLYSSKSSDLHRKIDETRDAYFGFIFPINRSDFNSVVNALNIKGEMAQMLYRQGKALSTFQAPDRRSGGLTNHIFGTSILALRGKDLDTGLSSVTDDNLADLVRKNEDVVLEIAEARVSWFGRIFFPAAAFSNAIGVFGGKVSPEAVYELASRYGFAAKAGQRITVRGDFGIAVWLTLLGTAP